MGNEDIAQQHSRIATLYFAFGAPVSAVGMLFATAYVGSFLPSFANIPIATICFAGTVYGIARKYRIPADQLFPHATQVFNLIAWLGFLVVPTSFLTFDNQYLEQIYLVFITLAPVLMITDMLRWPSKKIWKAAYITTLLIFVVTAPLFAFISLNMYCFQHTVAEVEVGKHRLELRKDTKNEFLYEMRNVVPGVKQEIIQFSASWIRDLKPIGADSVGCNSSEGPQVISLK